MLDLLNPAMRKWLGVALAVIVADHPGLCGRCVSNLYGEGEVRTHA